MLASSIGYYCSYVVANNVESGDDEYNFLISICLVLIALLIYYLYRYKKSNLGRW
jgi:membrane protein DedA with SNARE-associated domain